VPAEPAWLHPEAIQEARAAREWYSARNAETAEAFTAELDTAIHMIDEAPRRWPRYLGETRRYLLVGFPSSLFSARLTIALRFSLSRMRDADPDTGFVDSRDKAYPTLPQ
jgi:hypothetical protein